MLPPERKQKDGRWREMKGESGREREGGRGKGGKGMKGKEGREREGAGVGGVRG